MHAVLDAALAWVFGELRLHRVMLKDVPRNSLSGPGFQRESHARTYLQIADRWDEPVLAARIRAH